MDVDVWLDDYMQYALRTADIPGVVVTVVRTAFATRRLRYADVEKRARSIRTARFQARFGQRLITWTAAMQLVEQGKLDLDADINTPRLQDSRLRGSRPLRQS
jgi:CubicO group peptidase (beta-lactamase class C family)